MAEITIDIDQYQTVEQLRSRLEDVNQDAKDLYNEFQGRSLEDDTDAKTRWQALKSERAALTARIAELEQRAEEIKQFAADEDKTVSGDGGQPTRWEPKPVHTSVSKLPDNIHDLAAYRMRTNSPDQERGLLRDGAMKAVERMHIEDANVSQERAQGHIAHLLDAVDGPHGYLSRRILATSSASYRKAFWKSAMGEPLNSEEQRSMSMAMDVERAFTLGSTGMPVIAQLDPTIVPTSNYSVNPYRAIARVETISGTNEWKAATSGAITAAYSAEATQAGDNTPTLAQPDIIVEKAQAFVQFSIEVGQDWAAIDTEMRGLFADAKDDLEATKFTLGAGHGSTEPKGVITGATTTVTAGGTAAFAVADLYTLLEGLPPRFRPRATWLGNLFTFDKVRQFDSAGGSAVWTAPAGLQPRQATPAAGAVSAADSVGPAAILGRPAYESTAMVSVLTTGSKILVIGDFRYFVIVDRVGMNVEVVPLIVGTNHRPTGERGLYCYWRNSSDVLSANAFRVLVTG